MGIQKWMDTTARAVPMIGGIGMAFWLAWFGVAYGSSVWVQPTESTTTVVSEMFTASTLGHAFVLIFAAVFAFRIRPFIRSAQALFGGGLLATLGCVLVIRVGRIDEVGRRNG